MHRKMILQPVTKSEAAVIEGGLIAPDGDLNDFPRWLWPVIRPVESIQVNNVLNTVNIGSIAGIAGRY